ncbi:hypothetical protein SAMN05216358_4210 [Rhizobium sp. AN5]|uniref:hypothetical protein n=1 Tax=Rhizobium sp. AN5 TaxID=1855304 RepID=UPI000BC5A76F|nr:hypothetical protein [Rhizobium sp. AN5]SOC94010.1 hypothetical protein SAMN05216358_4210 [Rhizobium sp. AN5]
MSIDVNQIQSISDAALFIQALRKQHAEGYDVIADADAVLARMNELPCQTVEDALALIDVAQYLAANAFIEAGGDIEEPHGGSAQTSELALIITNLGRAIETINTAMVAHPINADRPAN